MQSSLADEETQVKVYLSEIEANTKTSLHEISERKGLTDVNARL